MLTLAGETGQRALAEVRQTLDGARRASSLVECINSVARMRQARRRRMTQELLDGSGCPGTDGRFGQATAARRAFGERLPGVA
jgi:hypothetical protein